MKKLLFLVISILCSSAVCRAYDFSAVAPSGQTLYYTMSGYYKVAVVYPGTYPIVWTGFTKPTGTLTIPSKVEYNGRMYTVTSIHSFAFAGCDSLSHVTIPSTVDSIGYRAFENVNFDSINIPSTVTSIDNAFKGTNLIHYCGTATGSPWGAKYAGCDIIYDADGHFVFEDSARTILSAYVGNDILVTIPSTVTTIGDSAFFDNDRVASVTIPNSVTSIGNAAFMSCYNLRPPTIPESVITIGDFAFADCNLFYSFILSNSVTSLGSHVFFNCPYLTRVIIGDSITTIPYNTFGGCYSLKSVTLGKSVDTINSSNFYVFYALDTLRVKAYNPPKITGKCDMDTAFAILIVPCGRMDEYDTAEYWKDFHSKMDECGNIGIDEVDNTTVVSVYPNPSDDHAVISCEGLDEDVQVTLYDQQGRKLSAYRMLAGDEQMRIDMSNLSSGIYIVRLTGNHTHSSQTLIKR